jgi:hypothetical protein
MLAENENRLLRTSENDHLSFNKTALCATHTASPFCGNSIPGEHNIKNDRNAGFFLRKQYVSHMVVYFLMLFYWGPFFSSTHNREQAYSIFCPRMTALKAGAIFR